MLNVNSVNSHFRWLQKKIGVFFMLMPFLPIAMPVWAISVTNFNGPPVLFVVKNVVKTGEVTQPVVINHELEIGESVCVIKPTPGDENILKSYSGKLFLELSLDGGGKKTLEAGQCHEVEDGKNSEKPTLTPNEIMVKNTKDSLGDWATHLAQASYEWIISKFRGGVPGSTTEEVVMPLLGENSKPAKLIAGKDTLRLAWEGNQSSYWVHIYQDGKPLQDNGFVVDKPEIVFPNLEKGFPSISLSMEHIYKVKVIGKEKGFVEGVFAVVADLESILPCKEMDKIKALESEKSLTKEEKDILIATLLIQNGLWLEAYQRVASQQIGIASSLRLFLTQKGVREKNSGEKSATP